MNVMREAHRYARKHRANFETYRAALVAGLRKYHAINKQNRGVVEMKGSEKQVAWAEEIKKGFSGKEQNLINAVQSKTRPEFAAKVAEAVSKISTIEDASWWIDNRAVLEMHSGTYADMNLKAAMGLVASAAKHLGMA